MPSKRRLPPSAGTRHRVAQAQFAIAAVDRQARRAEIQSVQLSAASSAAGWTPAPSLKTPVRRRGPRNGTVPSDRSCRHRATRATPIAAARRRRARSRRPCRSAAGPTVRRRPASRTGNARSSGARSPLCRSRSSASQVGFRVEGGTAVRDQHLAVMPGDQRQLPSRAASLLRLDAHVDRRKSAMRRRHCRRGIRRPATRRRASSSSGRAALR